nr:PREDICTED: protein D3-like [Bemisia tabaci]XP_018900414.1 PREDICTED: protein D3-like [Bemisia tabaci]
MPLYECSIIFGACALVGCVTVPETTEDGALMVQTPTTPLPDLQTSLKKHRINLSRVRPGTFTLHMMYANKSVTFGREFTPKELEMMPTSMYYTCHEEAFHTLVVVGLDVPTEKNHTMREWVHWILVNIPGSNISEGETIVPYQGPGWPYGNGSHRIVFMIHVQPWPHKISFSEKAHVNSPHRSKFDSWRFAEKYDIGFPVAVNFLICKTDWPAHGGWT